MWYFHHAIVDIFPNIFVVFFLCQISRALLILTAPSNFLLFIISSIVNAYVPVGHPVNRGTLQQCWLHFFYLSILKQDYIDSCDQIGFGLLFPIGCCHVFFSIWLLAGNLQPKVFVLLPLSMNLRRMHPLLASWLAVHDTVQIFHLQHIANTNDTPSAICYCTHTVLYQTTYTLFQVFLL